MSWSRGYSGTAAEVARAARDSEQAIVHPLPEFEKADVAHAIAGAERALKAVPEGAQVSLSLSGHGYEATAPAPGDTARSGSLSISLSYTLVAPPAA